MLVALLLGLLALPAAAETPGPLVAFNAGLNGGRVTLVTVAPDGTLRNLTPGDDPATADMDPSWSPDGTRIAFDSRRDGHVLPEIYVMNADGSDQRRLTTDLARPKLKPQRPHITQYWSERRQRKACHP